MSLNRHASLQPLSRDHHKFLIVAQLLKADAPPYPKLPTDLPGKLSYAIDVFENHMKAHWELEETVLFREVEGIDSKIDQLIYLLKDDHTEMEDRFMRLQGEVNQLYAMDSLGYLIEQHVRTEEREFFALIQNHLSEAQLTALAQAINKRQAD